MNYGFAALQKQLFSSDGTLWHEQEVPGSAVAATVHGSVPELLVAHVDGSMPFGDFRLAQVPALSSLQFMPIVIPTPISASAFTEVIANAKTISPNITARDAIEFL